VKEKIVKILVNFRIEPALKAAAMKLAKEARFTVSRYIEELVRRDLWSKGLLG
jgi:antitoxin component of RelBE/YafQ-DinJ toxin-antitoxin module